MKSKRYGYSIIGVLLFASIFACVMQRKNTLQAQVSGYHQAYRWKEYAKASSFVSDPEEFLKKTEELSDKMVVVDYEVVRTVVNRQGTEAEVEVVRSYHILPSVTIEHQRIVQQWKYDHKRRNWLLVSPY